MFCWFFYLTQVEKYHNPLVEKENLYHIQLYLIFIQYKNLSLENANKRDKCCNISTMWLMPENKLYFVHVLIFHVIKRKFWWHTHTYIIVQLITWQMKLISNKLNLIILSILMEKEVIITKFSMRSFCWLERYNFPWNSW